MACLEIEGLPDQLEQRVLRVVRVWQDCLELQDRVRLDLRDHRDLLELPEVLDLPDQEALKDFEVRMVTLELRANRDLQDPVVLLAHKETLASLACLVLPE